jgi:hypothetical protein
MSEGRRSTIAIAFLAALGICLTVVTHLHLGWFYGGKGASPVHQGEGWIDLARMGGPALALIAIALGLIELGRRFPKTSD